MNGLWKLLIVIACALSVVMCVMYAIGPRSQIIKADIIIKYVPSVSAKCKDGTYSSSRNRRGTCSRHGGVKEWIIKR